MKGILVIDDEPGIRGLLATILERKRYAVLLAEGAERGWTCFAVNARISSYWISKCRISTASSC